jgi:anti-sigma B factor antagonist
MELVKEQVGSVSVMTPQGEFLDASNAEQFKRDSADLPAGSTRVVCDMSRLQFVDSAGLGALLSCMRRLSGAGGDLKLCGLSRPVRATFEVSRMHRIFDIYPTKEDAIRAFE